MKPIDFTRIDDEHLARLISVLKKQLKRTDKHKPYGHAITENQSLLQMYQQEQARRKQQQ